MKEPHAGKKRNVILLLLMIAVILVVAVAWWTIHKKAREPKQWTVTQYGNPAGSQSMFYTIQADTGELIVVDGGFEEDAEYVRGILRGLGGKVDYWIVTHPHADHTGAFNRIYAYPDEIEIKNVYTINMDYERYSEKAQKWDGFYVYEHFLDVVKDADNVTWLYQGDELEIAGLHMTVLNAYGDYVDQLSGDLANDGSMMFKLEGNVESMLFCADVGIGMSETILEKYGDMVKSDYLQMGHHGYGGLSDEFYLRVSPKAAFFDAPNWLMENVNPATGETADYGTPEKVKLLKNMGADIYSFATAPNSVIMR